MFITETNTKQFSTSMRDEKNKSHIGNMPTSNAGGRFFQMGKTYLPIENEITGKHNVVSAVAKTTMKERLESKKTKIVFYLALPHFVAVARL